MVGCVNSLHIDSLAPTSLSPQSRQQVSNSHRGPSSSPHSMGMTLDQKPEVLVAFSRLKEENKNDNKHKKNQGKKAASNSMGSFGGKDDGGGGVVAIYSSFLEPVEVVRENIWSSLRMPITVGVLLLICVWHFSRQKNKERTGMYLILPLMIRTALIQDLTNTI